MTKILVKRANLLGDLRAENDIEMLESAFYESMDYRTLIESSDRIIVVGRRGTGKSALYYKLKKYWEEAEKVIVVEIIPDEDQVIGMRPCLELFGDKFQHVRAGVKLVWRCALFLEILTSFEKVYKFDKIVARGFLKAYVDKWKKMGHSVSEKCKNLLRENLDLKTRPEERIGNMAAKLQLKELEESLADVMKQTSYHCVLLMDRIDEGYEPDVHGIGFVDGVVQALIDIKTRLPEIKPAIFVRDNIFRAIALNDPDYSRNIEGQVLRLHWDEHQLFNLVCQRLRVAFKHDVESNLRLWDRCTARNIQGKAGFKKCLQSTLYRPRDILALLNDAFLLALKDERDTIIDIDIEESAKTISNNRLDDLHKEYAAIIPGLQTITAAFANGNPKISASKVIDIISKLMTDDKYDSKVQQSFSIIKDAKTFILDLYSIGFFGIKDRVTKNYVFCHDGKKSSVEILDSDELLVHPCYWIALNLSPNVISEGESTEIYDEYEIEVISLTGEIRKKRIDGIVASLSLISKGKEDSKKFEEWCFNAIKIIFAGMFRNIELKPNRSATQRRDIVATNLSESALGKRIIEDYQTRQVVFEIKNYTDIAGDEARQMASYLVGDYGKIGFIITRDDTHEPRKGKELDWIKEMYFSSDRKLIIKLTAKLLCDLLYKLKSPERYDVADRKLNSLLDSYTRLYLSSR
jgi:hypothetical protein